MNKAETYTPSNFRKNSYSLFHQVSNGHKIVQVTMSNGNGKPNLDDLIISKKKYLKMAMELENLKEKEWTNKLNKITNKLSHNQVPLFTKPEQYEKWCEKHHD